MGLAACGKKGAPVAPELTFPQPISDLQAFVKRGNLYLKWTIPKRNVNGTRLTNLLGFRIFRQTNSLGQISSTCPPKFDLVAEIDLDFPRATRVQDGVVIWKDETIKPGQEYIYLVIAYNIFKRASPESNQVRVSWGNLLPPPDQIGLRHDHRALEIFWETPTHLWTDEEKAEFQGMNIYRRKEGESYGFSPLTPQPLRENRYWDGQVELGKKYFYEVRPVRNFRGTLLEGIGSPEVSGIAKTVLPPAAPTGLIGVFQRDGIALRWDAHPQPDLAGYDLYRRAEDEKEFKKINPSLLTGTYFLDVSVDHQKTYYYRLKAIDSSPEKKESEFSRETEVFPLFAPTPAPK